MKAGNFLSSAAACAVALLAVFILAKADVVRFEEPEYSPLYKATLENSYSRWNEKNEQVPAGSRQEALDMDPGMIRAMGGSAPGKAPEAARAGKRRIVEQKHSPGKRSKPGQASSTGYSHIQKGNQYVRAGNYEKALASFRKHLQEQPESALAYHRIADVFSAQEKFEEAIAAYKKALRYRPNYYCCYGHIGDILVKQGKEKEAESWFEKLVAGYRSEAKQKGSTGAVAKYQLGKFFIDHNRNLKEGVSLAEEAVKELPEHVTYLIPLVSGYQKLGRKEDALRIIDKILELKPEYAGYYKNLREKLAGSGEN